MSKVLILTNNVLDLLERLLLLGKEGRERGYKMILDPCCQEGGGYKKVRPRKRRFVYRPLSTFLVSLCAIIGGVFTVASLIDSLIYHSSRAIQHKVEMNKYN